MATTKQGPHSSGRVVSVRLEDELIDRLDALASRTNRSRGLYLRLALRAALPTLEQLHWEQRAVEFQGEVIDRQFHALVAQLGTAPDEPPSSADDGPSDEPTLWRIQGRSKRHRALKASQEAQVQGGGGPRFARAGPPRPRAEISDLALAYFQHPRRVLRVSLKAGGTVTAWS